jgi:hypothetical protein
MRISWRCSKAIEGQHVCIGFKGSHNVEKGDGLSNSLMSR